MKVRPATAGDIPAILALEREVPTAAHWSPRRYEEIFLQSDLNRIAIVAAEFDEIRGFLIARTVVREWEIENVVVAESSRRSGIGSSLLDHFLSTARHGAAEAVFLEVRESNDAARALYQKFQFGTVGRRAKYYSHPEEDALVLRLNFS